MKKELLQKFIEKTLEYLQTVEAFAGKQVPAFVEEVLAYGLAKEIFLVVVCALVLIGASYLTYYSLIQKVNYERYGELKNSSRGKMDDGFIPIGVFSICGGITAFCLLACNLVSLLKAIFAPRLYLIECLREML